MDISDYLWPGRLFISDSAKSVQDAISEDKQNE